MSSDSNFGFTDEKVVYELRTCLDAFILDIFIYGVYTGIYFVALYLNLSRRPTESPRVGSAVFVTVLWVLVTIHSSITWALLDNVYVRRGETREAQLASLFWFRFGDFYLQRLADTVVSFISILLADITMIWRCHVLYAHRWIIIIIPGLFLLAGSVSYVWRIIMIVTPRHIRLPAQETNLELIFLSGTVITNIFCTTAIVYRIISVSGWRKSLKTYHRLMEILIESSILYTVIYMIRIGLQIRTQYFLPNDLDERFFFARALGYSITGIAPTLVIARLAAGFARPDDSWTRSSLPQMESMIGS